MKKISYLFFGCMLLGVISLSGNAKAVDINSNQSVLKESVNDTKVNQYFFKSRLLTNELSGSFAATKAASADQQKIVNYALQFLGVPYVWGGATPAGFDCSGLVQYSYRNSVGISLPRVTWEQEKMGKEVSLNDLQLGDLVFYGSRGSTYHVGIYIGNNEMVHAPTTGDVVKKTNLAYFYPDFARRILPDAPIGSPSETIISRTDIDRNGKVAKSVERYGNPDNSNQLTPVQGSNTADLVNQDVEIKTKVKTTSGKTFVLIRQNNKGICWIEESAVNYYPKVANNSVISRWGKVTKSSEKYSMPGNYLKPAGATTSNIIDQDVQVKNRVTTTDGQKFVLLLNSNGVGIGWVDESTVEIYAQIKTQVATDSKVKVKKVTPRYSATDSYLKAVKGYDTSAFLNQVLDIKSKIVTTDGKVFVLLAKDGSGICWVEESSIQYYPKVASQTDINRWGRVIKGAQKYSFAAGADYLTPVDGATSDSIIGQDVQVKTRIVTKDDQKFVLLLNEAGTGIAWVEESSIEIYDQIKSQTDESSKAIVIKNVPRYSATKTYLKKVIGYDTSNFLNQGFDIKSKIVTTDGKVFVLLAKDGSGICWVEESAISYYPKVKTRTDINRWGTVKVGAQKHSLANDSEFLTPINATTESIVNQEVQIKTKVETTDGRIFVLLLNPNGTGIAWVEEASIEYYTQIKEQTVVNAKATVIKNVPRYSATATYIKEAVGYNTAGFINQEFEIKSKIITTDDKVYVLIAKNGSGICWVEESAISYYPKVKTRTDINRWGTVKVAAQKHSLAADSEFLTPVNATTESIINQEVQIKTRVETTDGRIFVLLLNPNGTGIAWVEEASIEYYTQIKEQTVVNAKATVIKNVPRYSATATYIKEAVGYNTAGFINQEFEIKSKIITTDDKVYVLIAKNGSGICWVEESAVRY
ncbi:C40 family peptidase [Carnobacterium gallinarum]|uniref:C40 family peptidase n=1 Tax=Carnobacterium gallinarum TaxID=2749 RepID=UPI000691A51F|nr:C40 family peptidase [Carnobacterium gallinarum]